MCRCKVEGTRWVCIGAVAPTYRTRSCSPGQGAWGTGVSAAALRVPRAPSLGLHCLQAVLSGSLSTDGSYALDLEILCHETSVHETQLSWRKPSSRYAVVWHSPSSRPPVATTVGAAFPPSCALWLPLVLPFTWVGPRKCLACPVPSWSRFSGDCDGLDSLCYGDIWATHHLQCHALHQIKMFKLSLKLTYRRVNEFSQNTDHNFGTSSWRRLKWTDSAQ